jgi:hypothetical protein
MSVPIDEEMLALERVRNRFIRNTFGVRRSPDIKVIIQQCYTFLKRRQAS